MKLCSYSCQTHNTDINHFSSSLWLYYLSNRLVHYIVEHGIDITPNELDEVQTEHYSHIKCDGNIMRSWIRDLEKSYTKNKNSCFKVTRYEQPNLWQQQPQTNSCNILNEHDKYQFKL